MSSQPKSSNTRLLARLTAFLKDDLARVNQIIHDSLQSKTELTNEVSGYLQSTSGKRLRPMLALLAARVEKEPHEHSAIVATVAELLHVASLLHDDVIDRASLRRGKPTVNARWGDEVAILAADFLYSHAFRQALERLPGKLVGIFCGATAAMSDGEIFQIQKRDSQFSEEDYLTVVRCKTSELFAASMEVGSALTNGVGDVTDSLRDYGMNFGYAFQITDDVLDLTSNAEQLGKNIGTDIACGKQTLPLIHALGKASPDDRTLILEALNDGRPPELIRECVDRYGGIEYALEAARRHTSRARECLNKLPPSPAVEFLESLTELVIERTF